MRACRFSCWLLRLPGGRLRVLLGLLLAQLLVSCTAGAALSHAYLRKSSPPDKATLSVVPPAVCLMFTEPIEVAFSTFKVTDSSGQRVDDQEKFEKVKARLGVADRVSIPLKPIGPGTYRIEWRVLSIDTHTTAGGGVTFTVQEGARPDPRLAQGKAAEINACADLGG